MRYHPLVQGPLRSGDIEDGAAMSLGDFAVPGGLPDPAPAGMNGASAGPALCHVLKVWSREWLAAQL